MILPPGATSVTLTIQIVDDSGLSVTGLVAGTFPTVYYQRSGETLPSAISLSDLAAQNSSYSSGGVKELTGGYYRIDIPDAAFATASRIRIIGEASGKHVLYPVITCANIATDIQTIKTQTITCTASVTISPYVGNATHAIVVDANGFITFNNTVIANLTNAPTSGDFTSTMKTSIAASAVASVSGSVGSISGITFPTHFSDLTITASTGLVTVGTNNEKLDIH